LIDWLNDDSPIHVYKFIIIIKFFNKKCATSMAQDKQSANKVYEKCKKAGYMH